MLSPHDLVPHIRARTLDGLMVDYRLEIWQQRNLLLVCVSDPDDRSTRNFVSSLAAHRNSLRALNTELVVTADPLPGVPRPGLLVADRWGEIQMASVGPPDVRWPSPDDLLATISWVEMKCPECEGEVK